MKKLKPGWYGFDGKRWIGLESEGENLHPMRQLFERGSFSEVINCVVPFTLRFQPVKKSFTIKAIKCVDDKYPDYHANIVPPILLNNRDPFIIQGGTKFEW